MGVFEDIQQRYRRGDAASLDRHLRLGDRASKVLQKLSIDPLPEQAVEDGYRYELRPCQKKALSYIKKRLVQELVIYSGILQAQRARLIRDKYLVNANIQFNSSTKDLLVEYFTLDPDIQQTEFSSERLEEERLYLGRDKFNLKNSKRPYEGINAQIDILKIGIKYFNNRITTSVRQKRKGPTGRMRRRLDQHITNVIAAANNYSNTYAEYHRGTRRTSKRQDDEISDCMELIWEEVRLFNKDINYWDTLMQEKKERGLSRTLGMFGADVRNFMFYIDKKMECIEDKIR